MLLTIEKVIILKSINMFSQISESDLLAVAMQIKESTVPTQTTIMKQGDIGTSMYIVVSGEVDVVVNDKVVAKLKDKSVFGELAALDPEPRSATIVTSKETHLFEIKSNVLYHLIAEYPNVAKGIIKILCDKLRNKNKS